MELRDLRSFVAVARSGSFTAAATELGYTQSAVSQHVSALEASVGQTLLHRRPVGLTPAGERLLEHASHVLLRLDVARSELAGLDADPGVLRIAATPFAHTSTVAGSLRDLRAAAPRTSIILTTTSPAGAATAVAAGDAVDLALVDGIVGPRDSLAYADAGLLAAFSIGELPVNVGVPVDHPFAGRRSVDLDALVDARWIDAPALAITPSGLAGRTGRTRLGPVSRFVYHGTDVATLIMLVAVGHGLAFLPDHLAGLHGGVRLVRVGAPPLVHRLELLVLRTAIDRHAAVIDRLSASAGPPASP